MLTTNKNRDVTGSYVKPKWAYSSGANIGSQPKLVGPLGATILPCRVAALDDGENPEYRSKKVTNLRLALKSNRLTSGTFAKRENAQSASDLSS